ncbi:hypothetical protein chiPu_0028486, partial [Chiloscyllium punctatum]|nr:hypothetical protein [Chiloscyllium punctatum]
VLFLGVGRLAVVLLEIRRHLVPSGRGRLRLRLRLRLPLGTPVRATRTRMDGAMDQSPCPLRAGSQPEAGRAGLTSGFCDARGSDWPRPHT